MGAVEDEVPGVLPRFVAGDVVLGLGGDAGRSPTQRLPHEGGGYRRCIGFALATLELQQVVASVVQRTELAPRFTDPMPDKGVATMAPADPVLVERLA